MRSLPNLPREADSHQPDPSRSRRSRNIESATRRKTSRLQKLHGRYGRYGSAAGNLPEKDKKIIKDTRNAGQIRSVQWWYDVKGHALGKSWKARCSQKMPKKLVSGHTEASTSIYKWFHFPSSSSKKVPEQLSALGVSVQIRICISLHEFTIVYQFGFDCRCRITRHALASTPTKRESFGYCFHIFSG